MKIALLLAAVCSLSFQQDVPMATFTEPFVGFQFNYPKAWTITKTKRKENWRSVFAIPLEGTSETAQLEVDRTEFHSSTDLWQTIQVRANEQLHRQVVRQWSQEVLGVSMLFSRIDYTDHGTPTSAVLGLFYTRTNEKLLLRLTSPTTSFDKVYSDFNRVLETLRQTDGKLPEEDDPNVELVVDKKLEKAPVEPHALSSTTTGKKTKVKAPPVTVDIVVSLKKVMLRMPLGWTAEKIKGNTLDLREATLSAPLHVQLFSILDSDPAMAALTKLSASHLDDFDKVATREDSNPTANQAGCTVASVWRLGSNAKGQIVTCDAMGSNGNYYLLFSYRQTDRTQYKPDRKLIDLLLKQINLESAP